MINTTLTNSSGQTAKVLREEDLGGGKKLIYLATSNLDAWEVGESFTSEGVSGTIEDVVTSDMASIYEARTEQQVLDEDEDGEWIFGWRFKELGWAVDFSEGKSLYGDLVALNQNRSGLGVQGPTNISGNNGRPLALTQNHRIQGLPAQVNGWKDSTTPNSYVLQPKSVEELDDHTTYADAYVSWNDSGQITQETNVLRARPADSVIYLGEGTHTMPPSGWRRWIGTTPLTIQNPGFEDGMDHWVINPAIGLTPPRADDGSNGKYSITTDPMYVYEGERALLYEGGKANPGDSSYMYARHDNFWAFANPSGELGVLDVDCYIRITRPDTRSSGSIRFFTEAFDENFEFLSTRGGWGHSIGGNTLDTGWIKYTAKHWVRTDVTYVRQLFYCSGSVGTKIAVDSFQPTDFNPTHNGAEISPLICVGPGCPLG